MNTIKKRNLECFRRIYKYIHTERKRKPGKRRQNNLIQGQASSKTKFKFRSLKD